MSRASSFRGRYSNRLLVEDAAEVFIGVNAAAQEPLGGEARGSWLHFAGEWGLTALPDTIHLGSQPEFLLAGSTSDFLL